jgi:hypothetical protein
VLAAAHGCAAFNGRSGFTGGLIDCLQRHGGEGQKFQLEGSGFDGGFVLDVHALMLLSGGECWLSVVPGSNFE